jgi:hypothetical protein
MAELAAYFGLIQMWSAIVAAVILSALNFAIAIILVFVGVWLRHTR